MEGLANESRLSAHIQHISHVPHILHIPHIPHVPHVPHADTRAQGPHLLPSSRASGCASAAPLAPPALIAAALLASLALNLLLCTCLWRRRQRPPRATDSAERPKSD